MWNCEKWEDVSDKITLVDVFENIKVKDDVWIKESRKIFSNISDVLKLETINCMLCNAN